MTLAEILTEIRTLPHADKLRLLQRLASDLAHEEGAAVMEANADYQVWAPHDAYQAADALLSALKAERDNEDG